MQIKVNKISLKPVVMMSGIFSVCSGFILGVLVTVFSSAIPPEEGMPNIGPWAILLFPIFNGIVGVLSGMFLVWGYNLMARLSGGIVLECESNDIKVG